MDKFMPTLMETMKDAKLKRSRSVNARKSSKLGSKWEVVQQQSRELIREQSSEFKQVRQKGILIERGIKKCSSERNLKLRVEEVIGDCRLNSPRRREQFVQQTRDEFNEELKLDAKYASIKGILMEKGIRTFSDYECEANNEDLFRQEYSTAENLEEQFREEYVQQMSSNIKPAFLKEVLLEQGLLEAWENECNDSVITEDPFIDMTQIVNDINQFTSNLESNPHSIDWQGFRSNLLKIHRYYMHNVQSKDAQSVTRCCQNDIDINLAQVELDIENVMEPINTLITRSKTLSNHIEGVELKINSLDLKVEEFYAKYNQTLINREKAFNDMKALQSMREQIGQRLAQIEMDIHASRSQLLQRGVHHK